MLVGLVRSVAQVIALTIALAVATLAPSAAEAHPGHVHAAGASQVDTAAADAPLSAEEARLVEAMLLAELPDGAPSTVAMTQGGWTAALGSDRSGPGLPCTGGCCLAGMACCAPALLPELVQIRSPAASARLQRAQHHPVLPGLVLEALPEPPRPLA